MMPEEQERFFDESDLEARIAHLEEQMGLLVSDPTLRNLPYGGLKEAASMLSIRSIGNTLGGAFVAGTTDMGVGATTTLLVVNTLYAIPLYIPKPLQVAKIGIYVSTLASGNLRLGIYEDKGEDLLYPGKLVLDAGAVATGTTGAKGIVIKQGLSRGLKWIVLVASAAPTIYGITVGGCWTPLGISESFGWYSHYRVAFTYAALPNPFTASATETTGTIPAIWLKYS